MDSTRYHHGDLPAALIRAADEILAERGVEKFTLREAARRAGVSPAAPSHHFGSAAGLLTEVAVLGFEELIRYMTITHSVDGPTERLRMQAVGYVRFALDYPGRFHLMFRHDLLNASEPRLQLASERAMNSLAVTVRGMRALPADHPIDDSSRSTLLAVWSMVHGFAHLALDGKFSKIEGTTNEHLLSVVLPNLLTALWPSPTPA